MRSRWPFLKRRAAASNTSRRRAEYNATKFLPTHLQSPIIRMSLAVNRALYWLGVVLMLIGLADAALARFANFDLTGKSWTPLAFGLAGIVLMWVSRLLPQQEE
jgi:hypothetical protein